ncbi:MAG: peptidyl-tRNA hydrolase Pth2 [Candidatus Woesearchaeota archaeon]
MEYKQVIVIRADLQLPKGKACSQAAHAAVEATLKASESIVRLWRHSGQKKIVVKVRDEAALYTHAQQAKDKGLAVAIITDAGKTTIEPGTVTCCAIGPGAEADIDVITKDLSLL